VVDRLELIYEFLQLEKDLQEAKLKLLNEYYEMLLKMANAEGIKLVYCEMCAVMGNCNVVDLTQPHYSECYTTEIAILKSQGTILQTLITRQTNF
jgi:hypothetical protein